MRQMLPAFVLALMLCMTCLGIGYLAGISVTRGQALALQTPCPPCPDCSELLAAVPTNVHGMVVSMDPPTRSGVVMPAGTTVQLLRADAPLDHKTVNESGAFMFYRIFVVGDTYSLVFTPPPHWEVQAIVAPPEVKQVVYDGDRVNFRLGTAQPGDFRVLCTYSPWATSTPTAMPSLTATMPATSTIVPPPSGTPRPAVTLTYTPRPTEPGASPTPWPVLRLTPAQTHMVQFIMWDGLCKGPDTYVEFCGSPAFLFSAGPGGVRLGGILTPLTEVTTPDGDVFICLGFCDAIVAYRPSDGAVTMVEWAAP